ncbi:MAG TPA: tripartite tricarboxylate transporter substrate binding protein [Burkholderiales bacterium]|jgi:tripartite-type tricarboxylate transporter receptor subunit TctC|nr:tripartite tricarboxylate transporter substrate binding protein [Burkholderiales bacterium]
MKKTLLVLLLACLPLGAHAQAWPAKPIRWVVPYTPAGITDNVTRMVTQKLQESLGQSIVVENKPGANSIVGADLVAKAPPDGYTILTVIAAHAANATLYAGKLPYDPVKSFAPISLAAIAPLIMTANNNFPPKDVKELIDYAKKNPGKVAFGSSGIGAAAHLTTELFKQTTGTDMLHVPYKGTAPALTGLMGSDIQILVDVPSTLMPHVRGGKIKALAMFSTKRVPGAQEVPTMAEAGGPPLESSTWLLFLAPAGTPREIVNRLSSETDKVLGSTEIRTRFDTLGIFPGGGTPERAAQFLNDEIARWAKVIKTAGVKADD